MSPDQAFVKRNVKEACLQKEKTCLQCGYTCKMRKTLKIHIDNKHKGIFYSCKDCNYRGSRKTSLTRHMALKHQIVRAWPCNVCSYTTVTKDEIEKHQKFVHFNKLNRKQYSCEDCDYTNHRSNNLRNHINAKHIGIYFSCHLCDFKGSQKGHVKKHMESFHEQKKWPCDQCFYKATEKGSLKIHKDAVHLKVKYSCDQCDHKAAGKGLLRQHMETRHLGFTYSCSECDFVANSKPYLYLHSSKKHKKKGRVCQMCGVEFKSKTNSHQDCKPNNFSKIKEKNHQMLKEESKNEKEKVKNRTRSGGEDDKKEKSGKQPRRKTLEENDKTCARKMKESDIVKLKLRLPDNVEIKFEPKCEIVTDIEDHALNKEKTDNVDKAGEDTIMREGTIIKEENNFSFSNVNQADPAVEGFFLEPSEVLERDEAEAGELDDNQVDELDEYDFESIRPEMFGSKEEETLAEEFDFEMIEKIIIEREQQRAKQRS